MVISFITEVPNNTTIVGATLTYKMSDLSKVTIEHPFPDPITVWNIDEIRICHVSEEKKHYAMSHVIEKIKKIVDKAKTSKLKIKLQKILLGLY